MNTRHPYRLLCSLVLLGVLAAHTGLLVHAYEHDAAEHDAECGLCIAGPALKAAVGVAAATPSPAMLPAPLHRSYTPRYASTRTAFEARAPPALA